MQLSVGLNLLFGWEAGLPVQAVLVVIAVALGSYFWRRRYLQSR